MEQNQSPSPGNGARSPWVFVLKEGLLPGQFYLHPFRPTVQELPKVITDRLYSTFTFVLGVYEEWTKYGAIERRLNNLARLLHDAFQKLFAKACDQRVFVIPHEEFLDRVERGEFEVEEKSKQDRLTEGWIMRATFASHHKYGEALSWRLQKAVLPRGNNFNTVSAGIDERTNAFFWQWNGKKDLEIFQARKKPIRLRGEYGDLRGRYPDIHKIYSTARPKAVAA